MKRAHGQVSWPMPAVNNLPALTADEMREVDRTMLEEFAIQLPQMMENAGRNLAELLYPWERGGTNPRVCILDGGGTAPAYVTLFARH